MDDINYTGSHDWSNINIHENYEVEHWTKALGTNREELVKAVKVAGTAAEDIKKYFNM